jgi:tetratricopeptide (TPR) repeat protein
MRKAAIHVTKKQIKLLASGRLSVGERRGVVAHLLSRCEPCLALAREEIFPARPGVADYSAALRRAERAFLETRQRTELERREAEALWDRFLAHLDGGQRLRALRDNGVWRTWGLFALLLDCAKASAWETPFEAADLAHAALFVAESLPAEVYGDAHVNDFQAAAHAALGNVKRLLGDFEGAQAHLRDGFEKIENGSGDPYEDINLLSIQASLWTDAGELEEASELLRDAILLARGIRDRYQEARLVLQRSSSLGWLDPARGLDLAYRALGLLKAAGVHDEHLELGAWHLTALWSNELGDTAAARSTLESRRYLYSLFDDAVTRGRLLLLEGRIERNEGRLESSEQRFRELVELYGEHSMAFDLALACLEWSEALLLVGRPGDAAEVLAQAYPLIESWKVHVDVLRSWQLLREAVSRQAVETASFRELAMTLRRKWHVKAG